MKSFVPVFKTLLLLALLLPAAGCKKDTDYPPQQIFKPEVPPTNLPSPPATLSLHPFYKKYVDADGIPIISSEYTVDDALLNAKKTVLNMLGSLHDSIKNRIITYKVKVAIISQFEETNSLPEYAHFPDSKNSSRGYGATAQQPVMCTSEQNLVCGKGMINFDNHGGQDILTHEFAHSIHLVGFPYPYFDDTLMQTFKKAMDKKLWDSTYSATNHLEYWAVGVQLWYNCTQLDVPVNGTTIRLRSREGLKEYDPELYDLIAQYFTAQAIKTGCY